ncbi:hypothetical protein CK203_098089 [Vitis vinifera]|uniref:DYW domain-containing protein n=1 Tax=Vitis vinifera TaxID=29760 RepID=A0A438DN20_VITVI|nr:hypothetical protein CK203_098089 [Vitis vinifera]
MEKKKIQKTPGWSVVELQNEVHTFYSGTTSHPQAKKSMLSSRHLEIGSKLLVTCQTPIQFICTTIHLRKNLRVCGDCHNATKYIFTCDQARNHSEGYAPFSSLQGWNLFLWRLLVNWSLQES